METKRPLLELAMMAPLDYTLPNGQRLQLRFVSFGALRQVNKAKSDRDFFVRFIRSVSVARITLVSLRLLSDEELVSLGRAYLAHNRDLASHFTEGAADTFFRDFRSCYHGYLREQARQISATMAPVAKLIAAQMQSLHEGVRRSVSQLASAFDAYRLPQVTIPPLLVQDFSSAARLTVPYIPSLRALPLTSPAISIARIPPGQLLRASRDSLEAWLDEIDPNIERKWRGAWAVFSSESLPDGLAQSAHSMREVLRLLLMALAPDDRIVACSWYRKPSSGPSTTRAMSVRFALFGDQDSRHEREEKIVMSLITAVDNAYALLSGEAHDGTANSRRRVQVLLETTEQVCVLIREFRLQFKVTE